MNIGSFKEASNFTRSLTLGKVAFLPIAVNPTIAELKKMKDDKLNVFVPDVEPVYLGVQEFKNPDGSGSMSKLPYFDITVYLRSYYNADTIERITFRVYNQYRKSSTNKVHVINDYGSTNWLPEENIKSGVAPGKLEWYVMDGVKMCLRGEDSLIGFIRALRNLNNISVDDPKDKRSDNASSFSAKNLGELFKGNFNDIKKVILEVKEARVGFVTGIRTMEDGDKTKHYQDFYKEKALRPYQIDRDTANENIIKEIVEAQANNRYANTYFGLDDLTPRTFEPGKTSQAAPTSHPFETEEIGSFGAPSFVNDEPDDLPF